MNEQEAKDATLRESLQQLGKVRQIKRDIGEREAVLIECLRRIGRTVAPTRLEHPDLTVVFRLVGNTLLALGEGATNQGRHWRARGGTY